jgi:DNA processing protein
VIILEIITIDDNRYPDQLRNIKKPPKQLYAKGNIELLKTNIISIIGSRACSDNGIELTRKFTKELVYQGITITSGMAVGIDTIAHQTTLQEKGNTIAVLGNGFNHIFPKENLELYQQITENNGLVITEYPPEIEAKSKNFLERNRIVSGLAIGILVVEAAYRSGTSVTAKLAKQQGKKIFALPHELNNLHGVGTNRLIREGAKIVTSTEDIIKEFPYLKYKIPPKEKEIKIYTSRKICKNKEYNDIYQLITENPISLNEVCQQSSKNISEITNILLMLELDGYIEKVAGGYVCILDKK